MYLNTQKDGQKRSIQIILGFIRSNTHFRFLMYSHEKGNFILNRLIDSFIIPSVKIEETVQMIHHASINS